MRIIWGTGRNEDLNVRVRVGNHGAGVMLLYRIRPDGTPEEIGSAGSSAGEASEADFCFPVAQVATWGDPVSFTLSIAGGNPGNTDMPIFLRVDQPSGTLTPVDSQNRPLEVDEDGFLKLPGDLTNTGPGRWEFDTWFS